MVDLPLLQSQAPLGDTSPQTKSVDTGAYNTGSLELARALHDLGSTIPIYPVETLLPAQDETLVQAILNDLQNLRVYDASNKRWACCPVDPRKSDLKEPKAFEFLNGLIRDIKTRCPSPDSETQFVYNPERPTTSRAVNALRPNLMFVSGQPSPNVTDWGHVSVPVEAKKKSSHTEVANNRRKIIWNLHRIMCNDPCRRFTYGLTIENTIVRVWYASRSILAASESFDFNMNYDLFVRVVIFFLCSNRVDLGWDPSIEPISTGRNPQYKIKVFDERSQIIETYQTTEVIFLAGADYLRGRGTRVWKAFKLGIQKEIVVLKDCWIDADRNSEGHIRRAIQDNATDENSSLVERYFLTVLSDGHVRLGQTLHSELDQTRRLGLASESISIPTDPGPSRSSGSAQPSEPSQASRSSKPLECLQSGSFPTNLRQLEHDKYHQKAHYRIVFKEFGQPLRKCNAIKTVFRCLRDVLDALRIMHLGKDIFIHRDISPNNILIVNGQGRLADLEYSKEDQSGSSHDSQTGTLDYMAVEVADTGYLYAPFSSFHSSPLHDLESIAWTAFHAVISRRSDTQHGRDAREAKLQSEVGAKYFYSIGGDVINNRRKLVRMRGERRSIEDVDDYLKPYLRLTGCPFAAIHCSLCLVKAPSDRERESSDESLSPTLEDITVISRDCHEQFRAAFEVLDGLAECETVMLRDVLERGEKRGADQTNEPEIAAKKRKIETHA